MKDNWWWIGDVGHWIASAATVLLAFWLGFRVRKPRLKITATYGFNHSDPGIPGTQFKVRIHNSGSEPAYVSGIKLNVFGVDYPVRFYDWSNKKEVANNLVPANGAEDFFSTEAKIVEAWTSLPYWKKWVAAVARYLRVTVIVQDAGGNVYKDVFHYPWKGE